MRATSIPHEADSTTRGRASSMRAASSCRREPAEHDRVDRAEPRARQHREHGLRHHRQVDHDAVAALDAEPAQRAGETRDLVAQLAVGVDAGRPGDGAVVDQRGLIAATAVDVPVDRVVAGVELAACEPASERRRVRVEDALRRDVPVERARGLAPEALGVVDAAPVDGVEARRTHAPRCYRPVSVCASNSSAMAGRRFRTAFVNARRYSASVSSSRLMA